jgi:hypothetical protein
MRMNRLADVEHVWQFVVDGYGWNGEDDPAETIEQTFVALIRR